MKSLRDPKRRPTHPGAILREDVLPALEMTQTEFSQRIGVSRLSVSELLHDKRSMTPEIRP
jgi:addiction module HigA family antidote